MQHLNWNDLKYLLALHRHGSLRAAARALHQSDSTIARRIAALERTLGAPLFRPGARGQYDLTDLGARLLPLAEEAEVTAEQVISMASAGTGQIAGTVRLSSVPMIINRIITPRLADLTDRHPDLTLHLSPQSQNIDLTRRDADIAVRFSRPTGGSDRILAKRIGRIAFAAYRSRDTSAATVWIGYDDDQRDLPQARWLAQKTQSAPLAVADVETAHEAVATGQGVSLLPRIVADKDPRLKEIATDGPPLPVRDIWLLSHREQATRRSIQTVKDWLTSLDWH